MQNFQNSQFASIDIKDQIFEVNDFDGKSDEKKINVKLISIITASALAAVIVLVITTVVVLKKRINPNVYSSNKDKLELSRDITDESLITI